MDRFDHNPSTCRIVACKYLQRDVSTQLLYFGTLPKNLQPDPSTRQCSLHFRKNKPTTPISMLLGPRSRWLCPNSLEPLGANLPVSSSFSASNGVPSSLARHNVTNLFLPERITKRDLSKAKRRNAPNQFQFTEPATLAGRPSINWLNPVAAN